MKTGGNKHLQTERKNVLRNCKMENFSPPKLKLLSACKAVWIITALFFFGGVVVPDLQTGRIPASVNWAACFSCHLR